MIALLLAAGISLLFTLLLTPLFARLFKRIGWGQYINADGPRTHEVKRGTPTMGGIVFIAGACIGYFVGYWIAGDHPTMSGALVLYLMCGLALIGFVDDFMKTHRRRSLGLGPWQKVVGQVVVAGGFAALALNFPDEHDRTPASFHISAIRDISWLDLATWGLVVGGILFAIWVTFMVVAASNGVNLTDGLDGLAAGSSIFAFIAYIVIGFWQFNQWCDSPRIGHVVMEACYDVRDPLDLAVIAAAITGSLIGFLWWNTSPAQIFMGDTGSLGLGGAMAALAILSRTELLLVLVGGLFVIEVGSVALQRTYFKLTKGRRIFRASPLHHHFEMLGWGEVTVVVRFWIISALFVGAAVGLFYLEWISGNP
ncbi:MAG: phospho-N-acetylmuramoyl-pentapeptide-transferase [Micrococcales bacterium 73-13]|nr:MAG: phospho-N-acetylmuramoyl-pentapeptide-transferase [Micrococcales bacterium 73-13]